MAAVRAVVVHVAPKVEAAAVVAVLAFIVVVSVVFLLRSFSQRCLCQHPKEIDCATRALNDQCWPSRALQKIRDSTTKRSRPFNPSYEVHVEKYPGFHVRAAG